MSARRVQILLSRPIATKIMVAPTSTILVRRVPNWPLRSAKPAAPRRVSARSTATATRANPWLALILPAPGKIRATPSTIVISQMTRVLLLWKMWTAAPRLRPNVTTFSLERGLVLVADGLDK